MKKVVRLDPKFYDELRVKAIRLVEAEKEIAHLKACYEDTSRAFIRTVTERNAAREDLELVRRERGKLLRVREKFAADKERDAETIARLVKMMDQVVTEFNEFQMTEARKSGVTTR